MVGPGRPMIEDALHLILYVETGRRRGRNKKLSVRAFAKLRSTAYYGPMTHKKAGRRYMGLELRRVYPLRGEALRRRFSKAQEAIGLRDPDFPIDMASPLADAACETIDRLVADLLQDDK